MEPLKFQLTKSETDALKGIALILLLWHHLFYIRTGTFDDIELFKGHYLINSLGIVCKVCVSIFVFLSGYGLMASAERSERLDFRKFFVHRFSKLLLNYWLIWIIFVPIGISFFDRSFEDVYGTDIAPKLLTDLLGIYNIFGGYGYNPTWWFYSCIIPLYLLFPIFLLICKNKRYAQILFVFSLLLVLCPLVFVQPFRFYMFTFLLGIYFRNGLIVSVLPPPIVQYLKKVSNKSLSTFEFVFLILSLFVVIPIRFIIPYSLAFDTVITILIVMLYRAIKVRNHLTEVSLCFLGRHSFNIFLFHTFIYFLYFPELIYWHRNPVIIFLTLLVISIAISTAIVFMKQIIRFILRVSTLKLSTLSFSRFK